MQQVYDIFDIDNEQQHTGVTHQQAIDIILHHIEMSVSLMTESDCDEQERFTVRTYTNTGEIALYVDNVRVCRATRRDDIDVSFTMLCDTQKNMLT